MTQNENIVYANACRTFDDYTKQMRKNIERAFENHAINCEDGNPMYIGNANDIVAATIRCALKSILPFVGNKDNVKKLSEDMFHGFVSAEKELEFINSVFNDKD